ncbi:DNA-binding transcriptional regulator, AcrR family [Nocardiopsis flavescens]|uniref:DNA-binding transcriptional regulator, AcrR family n=1 Tax=Nocardiopsis flavescens TaxID=758803 RepID=A0A1M6I873_9ACTN|nr:TetR family transcriptional regulator [Nocardiopsis flavescens]SHJ30664.1 DNA-binding transcriptional regulator, AcrR family [Nocardiopsis flavescens]
MSSTAASDLTARARIRDAAIECFARRGFGATVRAIAGHAGVSPGLVIHHFGSKAGLRRACDEHVSGLVSALEGGEASGADGFLVHLAAVDEYADLLAYVLRTFQDGGPLAAGLYERMVADTARYFEREVRAGTVKPSRDPGGRARFAVASALGSLLVLITLDGGDGDTDYGALLRRWTAGFMLPALELYTDGVFADSSAFDAFLRHTGADGTADGAGDGPGTTHP